MKVFFDSNVFLKFLEGEEKAKILIEKVINEEWIGFINHIVVSEVLYGYIRAISGLGKYELKRKFPKLEIDISPVFDILENFVLLSITFDLHLVLEIMNKYRLLPNDALIAATCKYYGIKKIATFDEDFKRIDFLEIIEV